MCAIGICTNGTLYPSLYITLYITKDVHYNKIKVDSRQIQNVETRKQRMSKLMNIISFEQHLHYNENGTLELNGIIKNNEFRIEIKRNYLLQQHQALSLII